MTRSGRVDAFSLLPESCGVAGGCVARRSLAFFASSTQLGPQTVGFAGLSQGGRCCSHVENISVLHEVAKGWMGLSGLWFGACCPRSCRGWPDSQSLSFASPKESNQRKGDPGSSPLRGARRDGAMTGRFAKLGLGGAGRKVWFAARPQTCEPDCPGRPSIARRLSWGLRSKAKSRAKAKAESKAKTSSKATWIPACAGMTE